ncbi:hypothetical protein BCV70DRAFT_154698 [Testicularia cyperi]|uniref:Uncharacterized protein n=1 Tax=Testicularia cyperi TaxID=1882483 RepID=A0A317XZ97_9BASI|nr:hypothetical protein BCV70DRAFT_154698 [Testicularia cyperi]
MADSQANHEQRSDNADLEDYLLLLLSDSNLPTGGFVASSGLESFFAHGFLHNVQPVSAMANYGSSSSSHSPSGSAGSGRRTAPTQAQLSSSTLSFARSTLHSYARSSFPFLSRVHAVVAEYLDNSVLFEDQQADDLTECLKSISWLDYSYHTLLLNHVARRASKAQGIALLTLYSKAFAKPINLEHEHFDAKSQATNVEDEKVKIAAAARLVDRLKLDIRKSASKATISPPSKPSKGRAGWVESGSQHGHLPICWAVFSACLGLSLRKALYLHLFLQARSLFSSSIRLNTLGPYLAHQIMRFQLRPVINDILDQMESDGCSTVPESRLDPSFPPFEPYLAICPPKPDHVDQAPAHSIDDGSTGESGPQKRPSAQVEGRPRKAFKSTPVMVSTHSQILRPKVQSLRLGKDQLIQVLDDDPTQGWAWDWPEDHLDQHLSIADSYRSNAAPQEPKSRQDGFWTTSSAPATTFPLGEIVQARHDQLHSRLFNS